MSDQPPEKNLAALLATMEPTLREGTFVFSTLPNHSSVGELNPVLFFQEREGITVVVEKQLAERQQISGQYPCRMITLNVHSSLEAVGFLARITQQLAGEGISVNPVSAFYHDHLFVPEDKADLALRVLRQLSRETKPLSQQ